MDDEHSTSAIAGWLAGLFGLLLALVAWGREVWKQRHERANKTLDVQSDLAKSMLARIAALEAREEKDRQEAKEREDTLRVRIEKVEEEADECQKNHAILNEQHRVLLREAEDLREENDQLRVEVSRVKADNETLHKQNSALHDELQTLYKQMGLKRSPPPPAPSKKRG